MSLLRKIKKFLEDLGNFGSKKGGNLFIGIILFIIFSKIGIMLIKSIFKVIFSKENYCVENYREKNFFKDVIGTVKKVFGISDTPKSNEKLNGWDDAKKNTYHTKLDDYIFNTVKYNYNGNDERVLKANINVISECLTHALAGSIDYDNSEQQFNILKDGKASNTIIGFTLQRCIEYNGFTDHKSLILSSLNVNNTAEKFKEYYVKENYSDKKMINNTMERINMRLNSVDKEIEKTSANVDKFLKKSK